MDLYRIGDKLINPRKIEDTVLEIFHLRGQGLSQQDVADKLSLDRTFISRLESIGEVRRGGRVALLGLPLANKQEVRDIAESWGVDYILLMDDEERWKFLEGKKGIVLFNQIMEIVSDIRACDLLIVIASSRWKNLAKALLDIEIMFFELGDSPIKGDKEIDPGRLEEFLSQLFDSGRKNR